MVVINSSRMKLQPGEARIDPLLSGVAWVDKQIGDRTYQALVDARDLGDNGQNLQCIPHGIMHDGDRDPEGNPRARVVINEWTSWLIPRQDFQEIEWVQDRMPPVNPMTREELEQFIQTSRNLPHGITCGLLTFSQHATQQPQS